MLGDLSRREIRQLSERLRSAEQANPADIELLGALLIEFNGAMDEVAKRLREIGLSPTTRLKTSGTIIDKLKRSQHLNLGNIRDLAGARVVQRMTLDEQDLVARQINEIWPNAQLVDRRLIPSFGYRAVHLVPQIDSCRVEIQLRTIYQDTWAQIMETFGDWWGRAIRYGGQPEDPDANALGSSTRSQVVAIWTAISNPLHDLAKLENELARLQAQPTRSVQEDQRVADIQSAIDRDLGRLGVLVKEMAEFLNSIRSDPEGSEGMVAP